MIRTRCGYVTITGNYRSNNEDNLYVDPEGRFFLVADGMGGQSAGEKASQLATELVPEKLDQLINFENDAREKVRQAIDEAVGYANTEIMALGKMEPEFHNMGTTIVFVVGVGEYVLCRRRRRQPGVFAPGRQFRATHAGPFAHPGSEGSRHPHRGRSRQPPLQKRALPLSGHQGRRDRHRSPRNRSASRATGLCCAPTA